MLSLLLTSALVSPAAAQQPAWEEISRADGLETNWVRDLHQEASGRVVAATSVGVFAWDGERARRIDGGRIRSEVVRLESFGSELVALDSRHRAWVVQGEQTRLLQLGGAAIPVRDIAGRSDGGFVLRDDGTLTRVDGDGEWVEVAGLEPGIRGVWTARSGVVLAGVDGWGLLADGQLTPLDHPVRGAEDALVDDRGTVWLADRDGVWSVEPGRSPRHRMEVPGLRISLALFEGAVWAAAHEVVAFSPDGTAHRWGPGEGHLTNADALLVDREGGVWVGGVAGIRHAAAPDLVHWTREHGLANHAHRRLETWEGRVWITQWGALSVLEEDRARQERRVLDPSRACADGDGHLWVEDRHSLEDASSVLRVIGDDMERVWPGVEGVRWFEACETDPSGFVWYTLGERLIRARGSTWTVAGTLPATPGHNDLRSLDIAGGRVHYTSGRGHCTSAIVADRVDERWSCTDVGGVHHIMDIAHDADGRTWLVGSDDTVLVSSGAGLTSPPAASTLPGMDLTFAEPSRDGGVWIGGEGPLWRVELKPDGSDWVVLERLDDVLGAALARPTDLVELPTGDLYVASRYSLIRVPASERRSEGEPPSVHLAEVRLDGLLASRDAPVIQMQDPDAVLQLRFGVYSFRAREALRLRTRIDDRPWSAPTAVHTEWQWQEIPPGERRVSVQASRDGRRWGPATVVRIAVPRPWYGRWEAWLGGLLLAGTVPLLWWRHRVRRRLREARLRSLVARDLHDEIGGELGALRLLTGLLASDLSPDRRAQVSARAVRSLSAMTQSVRGIVWSLQPRRPHLHGLVDHLMERCRTSLPHLGDALTCSVDLPDTPVPLGLDVVRGVRLVVREALHNVAKHSHAEHVELRVGPAGRGRWRVSVIDDGVGFIVGEQEGAGQASMRARAREIGAQLRVESDASGTRVSIEFTARAGSWRAP